MDNEKKIISDFYNDYELIKVGETNSQMPVGMLLASLVSENLVQEDKFIEVQNNLKELKKLGDLLNLDKRLVGILSALVP